MHAEANDALSGRIRAGRKKTFYNERVFRELASLILALSGVGVCGRQMFRRVTAFLFFLFLLSVCISIDSRVDDSQRLRFPVSAKIPTSTFHKQNTVNEYNMEAHWRRVAGAWRSSAVCRYGATVERSYRGRFQGDRFPPLYSFFCFWGGTRVVSFGRAFLFVGTRLGESFCCCCFASFLVRVARRRQWVCFDAVLKLRCRRKVSTWLRERVKKFCTTLLAFPATASKGDCDLPLNHPSGPEWD